MTNGKSGGQKGGGTPGPSSPNFPGWPSHSGKGPSGNGRYNAPPGGKK